MRTSAIAAFDAAEPRIDAVRVLVFAGGIACSVVVEAQRVEAERREPLGENSQRLVGRHVFVAEGRAHDDASPAAQVRRRRVMPCKERTSARGDEARPRDRMSRPTRQHQLALVTASATTSRARLAAVQGRHAAATALSRLSSGAIRRVGTSPGSRCR